MSEDRCVICGQVIPEGTMVCPTCETISLRDPPIWYAIKHKASGRFLYGTDFNYTNCRQRLSDDLCAPRLFSRIDLRRELLRRHINLKKYEIVPIQLKELHK